MTGKLRIVLSGTDRLTVFSLLLFPFTKKASLNTLIYSTVNMKPYFLKKEMMTEKSDFAEKIQAQIRLSAILI